MYERSAIVLERYFENLLNYRREYNIRDNYSNYCGLVEKLEKYQTNYQKELAAMQEYNESLDKIKEIQQAQKNLYKKSAKLEYNRNLLFNNLDGKVDEIRKCIEKIEADTEQNNADMKETKENLLEALKVYNDKRFELSKCKRYKKMAENDFNELYEISKTNFDGIPSEDVMEVKTFAKFDDSISIIEALSENGKDEKIPFNEDVIKCATNFGIELAKKEAASYLVIYEKMNKLLSDIESGTTKINLHKKYVRNEKAKVDFIYAAKDYLVQFLDYERMTVIHGRKSHNRLMNEACENFDADVVQINNLYELLLKEISNKATKKAYKELYNKSYLTEIKEKEEKFKKEKNRVNLNTATLINSNYWRIDGIREIYTIFYKNVSEVFGKDVAEFDIPKEFKASNSQDADDSETSDEEKEEKDDEEEVEKIPFQIDGYDSDDDDEDYDIEDNDIENLYAKVGMQESNDEEDGEDDDYDDESDEEENYGYDSLTDELLNTAVSKIKQGSDIDEDFDIFGEKYKEIDFSETNVIAAKSKVEEEMKKEKEMQKASQIKRETVPSSNIFKNIEIEDNEDEIPYEIEDNEVQLFDEIKSVKINNNSNNTSNFNGIEDFDVIRDDTKKEGVLKKLRKIGGTKKKNKFNDDIW